MQRTQAQLLRAVLALSGWLALAVTVLPGGSPLRWIPILLFVTFCPGLALLHPRPRGARNGAGLETVALAAPLSLSLAVLASTALFLVQGFSATVFLVSLATFCTVTAVLPGLPLPVAIRGARRETATEAGPEADAQADAQADAGADVAGQAQ
ncbi:hypothetical protein [Streptomyces sp. 150FB]|uniref:hypothetical protein n=1 Tax=Streptomyces sp. 150FB TaxID=1576605 RepID=UPI0007C699E8|nr:hypothetical protein [Streptomyces sp. 150FB]